VYGDKPSYTHVIEHALKAEAVVTSSDDLQNEAGDAKENQRKAAMARKNISNFIKDIESQF
jgi:hypothetical protein